MFHHIGASPSSHLIPRVSTTKREQLHRSVAGRAVGRQHKVTVTVLRDCPGWPAPRELLGGALHQLSISDFLLEGEGRPGGQGGELQACEFSVVMCGR